MTDHDRVTLRSIEWTEIFPWLSLGKSFRLAVSLRLLVLGAMAILLTLSGWWLLGQAFSTEERPGQWWAAEFGQVSPAGVIDQTVPSAPPASPLGGSGPVELGGRPSRPWTSIDPFFHTWAQLSTPVWQIFTRGSLGAASLVCLVLSGLWAIAVWAFFGAAITRIAAVELATDEHVTWAAALRWAAAKWISYFGAPLFPLGGVLLVVLPLAMLGLIMRLDVGLVLAGLLWGLALLGGLVITVLLLGLVFGWPLMWATISTEGTDTFDALSRSYAYVFQRPLRYLFYALVAGLLGWLGWLLVANLAAGIIWFAFWATTWGTGVERAAEIAAGLEGFGSAGNWLLAFWAGIVKLLAMGYLYSYFWTASTAIYYQLRHDVDATETDEVFLPADENEKAFSLPPITTDSQGAPKAPEMAVAPPPVPVTTTGNGDEKSP